MTTYNTTSSNDGAELLFRRLWDRAKDSEVLWFGIFLCLSILVTIGALTADTRLKEEAGIVRQVEGTAHKPFVYRQLVPLTIRLVEAAIPSEQQATIGQTLITSYFGKELQKLGDHEFVTKPERDIIPVFLTTCINLICLMGFVYIFRALLRDHLTGPVLYLNITAAVTLYGMVYLNREGVYCYDYPLFFLYFTAILLMSRSKWLLYYPIFLLATMNKETTVLLILIYVLVYWHRRTSRSFVFHLIAQLAVYTIVTVVIRYIFSDNPGGFVEVHWQRNLKLLANPEDKYDYLLLLLISFALVAWEWRQKPLLFKQLLVVLIPLLVLTFPFGWIDELRDYYEAYPAIIALASIPVATHIFGVSVTSTPTLNR